MRSWIKKLAFGAAAPGLAALSFACSAPSEATTGDAADNIGAVQQGIEEYFTDKLWPNGVVPYRFASSVDDETRTEVKEAAKAWNDLLAPWVKITECTTSTPTAEKIACPSKYMWVKQESFTTNTCPGHHTSSPALQLKLSVSKQTIIHEMGHCLGIPHEFNRRDRGKWLTFAPGMPDPDDSQWGQNSTREQPILGNFDFDGATMYSTSGDYWDYWGTPIVQRGPSKRDVSRVLQMYAREAKPDWGFFVSMSPEAESMNSTLPNVYLTGTVAALGTPAVAVDRTGTSGHDELWHVIVRGTNNGLYHKRMWSDDGETHSDSWQSMGSNGAGSDPAAVVLPNGDVVAAFVGIESGKVVRTIYDRTNDDWGTWYYVKGGLPNDDVRSVTYTGPNGAQHSGYVGPGIASRSSGRFDIIAARQSGGIGIVSGDGQNFTDWQTKRTEWIVRARPAAVATASDELRVVLNVEYEIRQLRITFDSNHNVIGTGTATNDGGNLISRASPPGIGLREDGKWRIVAVNDKGRAQHLYSDSSTWRDIGGMPQALTGVGVDWAPGNKAKIAINGEDMVGCDIGCGTRAAGIDPAEYIRPGGLWLRQFY